MSGAQRKNNAPTNASAHGDSKDSNESAEPKADTEAKVDTEPKLELGAPPSSNDDVAPPDSEVTRNDAGVTETITTRVAPVAEVHVDLSKLEDTTLLEVVEGRCATHAIRPEYLRGGEQLLAADAYGGTVGAAEMIRKGILKVVTR